MTDQHPPEFSRPVNVDRLPKGWTRLTITANEAECRALAERFGIPSVESLAATIRLKPLGSGRMVRLEGRLEAAVVQSCIISLEPVAQRVEEEFSLVYGPPEPTEQRDITISLDEVDPPEPIVDGLVDVGEAVAEHLALGLDPFPRRPDAALRSIEADEVDEAPESPVNPFAALAALKRKSDEH